MLDETVSVGVQREKSGSLKIMVGGRKNNIDKLWLLFEYMVSRSFYFSKMEVGKLQKFVIT